jgi:hypothetical protein
MNASILILETGDSLAMRVTDDALAGAGTPHFIVEFRRSGGSMQMPCAPSFGWGYRWRISGYMEHRSKANVVLRQLPVDAASGSSSLKDVPLSAKTKRWRAYSQVLGTAAIVAMALLFISIKILSPIATEAVPQASP